MRKALLLSAVAAMFLFSCKKDATAPPKSNAKLYKVTFDAASNFSQSINSVKNEKLQLNSLTTDATNIGSYTTILGLKIFSSNGTLVRQIIQYPGDVTNYGVIVDSLATGTYTVEIAAGQTGFYMSNASAPDVLLYAPGPFTPWSDTFVSYFPLTVTNSAINQSVTLSRVVANLEVDFTGTIPSNAARVDMNLNQEDFQYTPSTGLPSLSDTITYHYTVPDSVKGTNAYSISHIVLNTVTPINVILTAYDASNKVIATHTITNVTCTKNQRTILTGNFSNQVTNSSAGFSVTVNPDWGAAPGTVHY